MKKPGRTYIVVGVFALIASSCGGTADTAADETLAETTTTETAPTTTQAPSTTTSEATTSTTEHMDDSHMDDDMHEDDASAVPDVAFEVTMTEFAFEPTSFEVVAGQTIKFVIKNDGLIEHEFRASNAHRIEEHIAAGHEDHDDEGGHHEGGDIIVLVQPGDTEELVMTFPNDMTMYTEIACLLPGHYEAGMKAELSYTSS